MNLQHIRRTDRCLNCETPLDPEKDNFCPNCGQLNNTRKETALDLVRELAGDFLHLDSKVTRNIGPLLFKPGKLTNDYLAGKRARYFHPVRLFLIVTVIMFIIQGFTSHYTADNEKVDVKEDSSGYSVHLNGEEADGINLGRSIDTTHTKVTWNISGRTVEKDSMKYYIMTRKITDPSVLADTLGVENTFFTRFMLGQVIKSYTAGFEKVTDYFKHKLPWMLFALMPVFAFVMWLVYIRRNYYFSDHLVYAFHLHTATFTIFAIECIADVFIPYSGFITIAYPLYYFASLKNVYKQSWGKTILKGILAGILYCILGFFAMMFIALILFLLF